MYQNGSIAGFFFGDELVGGAGLPLADLNVAVDAVREAFPRSSSSDSDSSSGSDSGGVARDANDVILFENEAAHIFLWQADDGRDCGPNKWQNFTNFPTGLTHVSVDIYHFLPATDGPRAKPCGPDGAFNCTSACLPTPSTAEWTKRVEVRVVRVM